MDLSWFRPENTELGAAGAVDGYTRIDDWAVEKLGLSDTWVGTLATMNNTYFAPAVYASQASADPAGESYSKTIADAAEHGAPPEVLASYANAAAGYAEDHGALSEAAMMTARDVYKGAGNAARGAIGLLPMIAIGVGAVAAVVVVVKLA